MNCYKDITDWIALHPRFKGSAKIGNNTYLIELESIKGEPVYGIKLHDTIVVTHYPDGTVMLDSENWDTVTTKSRMGQFSPLCVYSRKRVWYVSPPAITWHVHPRELGVVSTDKPDTLFHDGITWHPKTGFDSASH